MYLFVSYMLYLLICQIKKVFNPANAIQRLSNKITIALIINFGNLKNRMVVVRQRLKSFLFSLHEVINEYIILNVNL